MTTPLVLTFVGDDRPGTHKRDLGKDRRVRRDLAREPVGAARRQIRRRAAGQRPERHPRGAGVRRFAASSRPACASPSSGARRSTAERPGRTVTLDILGQERPGIVRDVTQSLIRLGVNIEEFTSGLEREPFSGAEMFRAKRA